MQPAVIPASFKAFNLAMIQLGSITANKSANLIHAKKMILQAIRGQETVSENADGQEKIDLVMLPEIFNSPTESSAYRKNAEPIPTPSPLSPIPSSHLPSIEESPTLHMLSEAAREQGVYIIGGSIPECQDGEEKLWNTCTVWDPQGNLIAKHRKIHMYDVDIPGGITFMESKSLSPGDKITVFDTPFGKIATAICFDIRFPSLLTYILQVHPDVCAFLLPSAFNMTTGPRDWELLQRMRAVDNQIYVGMCSGARDTSAQYVNYGHTLLASPRGDIISSPTPSDEGESIVFAKLDPSVMRSVREGLPLWRSQKYNVYGKLEGGDKYA